MKKQLGYETPLKLIKLGVRVMVFYASFNNISMISWRSDLLVEETRVPGENHGSATSHPQAISHNVVSSSPHEEWDSNRPVHR